MNTAPTNNPEESNHTTLKVIERLLGKDNFTLRCNSKFFEYVAIQRQPNGDIEVRDQRNFFTSAAKTLATIILTPDGEIVKGDPARLYRLLELANEWDNLGSPL